MRIHSGFIRIKSHGTLESIVNSDGILASASRYLALEPAQVRFAITATAPYGTSLNDVLTWLEGAGIQTSDIIVQWISLAYVFDFNINGVVTASLVSSFNFEVTLPLDSWQTLQSRLATRRETATGLFSVSIACSCLPRRGGGRKPLPRPPKSS